ncbi:MULTISPECIES: FG-GAP-like repeat-containing protein [Maribacter]|uniref:FG-GAP-like repeat-containing protein n=1 Tax=Maribacter flavus TaxID=1658664 RepID=A0ABU7IFU5_9FLAO|nr:MULTISPECIES: FG-GAP-like repeat-containing protein [Maribacter]MDC6404601.1 FG-GAP-like repeat-containing protein [Maribacter sp. PR66]MEE1971744.1 FG-GAP-like repeat-containing protein [Maribacter flavus]
MEASDWSWGALIFDMDHDGLKDLFVANGVYQDLTDQDYLTYISNTEILKSMITTDSVNYAKLIDLIPSNKVENHAYKNLGNLEFKKYEESGLLVESFSNGAAYGDLDNDGDLDLVVNNLNMESFVYENTTMDSKKSNYLKFDLRGEGKNTYAVGSKIEVLPYNISVENQPVRGFQSSMDIRPNIGLPNNQNVSVKITWPSGKITQLNDINVNRTIILYEKDAEIQALDKSNLETPLFQKVEGLLDFVHKENRFVDFDRDRLLNHMVSTEGPKMALGDVNGDGRIDLFIGGSKGNPPSLFINTDNGFVQKKTSDFDQSKNSEDMESIFFDADGDNDMDLYVCSGGIEYSQYSAEFLDRLYINDGKGNFKLSDQKLPVSNTFHSSSTVDVSDIDQDGDLDIFVGERMIPLKYGMAGSGFLLENDGNGNFTDITMTAGTDFQDVGMITSALFQDLDHDGDEDLIIVGEFMGIEIFINEAGKFVRKVDNPLLDLKGWWNTIVPSDLDGDGEVDFIVGNHGLNSRFKASKDRPIRLYAADFDGNGFIDPILTFRREDGQDYPYALRHDLIEQIKAITKKYPDYESFKDASVSAIFSEEALKEARTLEANTLESVILVNNGNLTFEVLPLPIAAQFSTTYAIATNDFDGDGDQDIVLGGNLYNVKPEVGRYDASYGVYMENKGGLKFETIKSGKGFKVKGEIRDMGIIDQKLFVSRNRDSLAIFKFNQ